ncbi:MAG: hypothetical protein JKY94_17630 [Rhodobacteraceae bacterium]|nr:hypothetical protein [Paracoccaceae bacterium]
MLTSAEVGKRVVALVNQMCDEATAAGGHLDTRVVVSGVFAAGLNVLQGNLKDVETISEYTQRSRVFAAAIACIAETRDKTLSDLLDAGAAGT